MFPYVVFAKDQSWQAGLYPGVELVLLHRNEPTGRVSILPKFHAGSTIPHPARTEVIRLTIFDGPLTEVSA